MANGFNSISLCVIIEELCVVEGNLGFGLGLRASLDFSSCHNLIHILDNQALESSNSNFIFTNCSLLMLWFMSM